MPRSRYQPAFLGRGGLIKIAHPEGGEQFCSVPASQVPIWGDTVEKGLVIFGEQCPCAGGIQRRRFAMMGLQGSDQRQPAAVSGDIRTDVASSTFGLLTSSCVKPQWPSVKVQPLTEPQTP
jgi:hypothetical protein